MPYVSPCAIALPSYSDPERVVRDVGSTLGRRPVKRHLAVVRRGDSVADQLGSEPPIGAHNRHRRRPEVAILTPVGVWTSLLPILYVLQPHKPLFISLLFLDHNFVQTTGVVLAPLG